MVRNGKLVALAVLALTVAACGGSSSNGGGSSPAVSRGAVQGFGSLVVNGVRWNTNGATLVLDDGQSRVLSSEAEIQGLVNQGAVVTVKGRRAADGTTGSAERVEFKTVIEGPITDKDPIGGTFKIAGMTIIVEQATKFVGVANFEALSPTARVDVSGVPASATSLRATMVALKTGGVEYEAKGFVVNLAGSNFGLSLISGGQAYLNVALGSGVVLPAGTALVEVKGPSGSYDATTNTLTATIVEAENRLFGDPNDEAEVEGIVTGGASFTSFSIGDRAVNGASAAFFGVGDGRTAAQEFAIGIKVEAEGSVDASGTLVARKIKLKDGARLGAPIVTAPTGALSGGTATLLGKTVHFDSQTQIDEPGNFAIGTFVEVRGYSRPNGDIQAQRVRLRAGGSDKPFLQGLLENENVPFSVNGIAIVTNASTEYQNENEVSLGRGDGARTAFFNLTTPNRSLVKVRWPNLSSLITEPVEEVEIEVEDD